MAACPLIFSSFHCGSRVLSSFQKVQVFPKQTEVKVRSQTLPHSGFATCGWFPGDREMQREEEVEASELAGPGGTWRDLVPSRPEKQVCVSKPGSLCLRLHRVIKHAD